MTCLRRHVRQGACQAPSGYNVYVCLRVRRETRPGAATVAVSVPRSIVGCEGQRAKIRGQLQYAKRRPPSQRAGAHALEINLSAQLQKARALQQRWTLPRGTIRRVQRDDARRVEDVEDIDVARESRTADLNAL